MCYSAAADSHEFKLIRNLLIERSRCKVEAEVIRQQEAKRGSTVKSEAQEKAISILRLR